MSKIFYELKQNTNSDSVSFGKWFAYAKAIETLNTRKLAQHISEHGSIYTPDVVFGVLEKFRSCLVEMLLESKRVKIDGLGTFFCTIENKKGGAVSVDKFKVQTNLEALHIRFIPEQEEEMNISSREFLKKAEFINIATWLKTSDEEAENGGTENGGSTDNGGSDNGGSDNGGSDNGGDGDDGDDDVTLG